MIAVYLAMLETDVDRDKFMKLYVFFTFVYFVCLPVQWATRKQEKVDLLLGIPVTHFILCNFALLALGENRQFHQSRK